MEVWDFQHLILYLIWYLPHGGFYDDLSRLSSDLTITICKCVSAYLHNIHNDACHGVSLAWVSCHWACVTIGCLHRTGDWRPGCQAPAPGNSPALGPQQPQPIAEHWEVIIKLNCLTRSWKNRTSNLSQVWGFLNIVKNCKPGLGPNVPLWWVYGTHKCLTESKVMFRLSRSYFIINV